MPDRPRLIRRLTVALVATGAVLGFAAPLASADRAPSRAERTAIKRVALDACQAGGRECDYRRARVSTRNARYAWADVIGEGFSGVLVKRRRASARRFRVIGIQGGGIAECSYWRARAPSGVLRDLRISGLVDDSGATRNCG